MRTSLRQEVALDVAMWAQRWRLKPTIQLFFRLLFLEPGFQVIWGIRLRQACAGAPVLGKLAARLIWYRTVTKFGCDIGVGTTVGSALYLPHPYGIVVHGDCKIGDKVTILQGVTIGLSSEKSKGPPILRDGCVINAGAKVLGQIVIGEGAIVGANAVVLRDVGPRSVAVGIPAREIQTSSA